jgi:hypothetical protein
MHYQKQIAMKQIFAILAVLLAAIGSTRAQVSINNDGSTPHPSAMLEIKSFNKGLLVPRSSSVSIFGIPSPRNGLLAYDTTNERFRVRAGNSWYDMVDSRSWTRNTGASEQVVYTFDSVGIGTSLPATKLHISSSAAGAVLRLGTNDPQIDFYQGSTATGFINTSGADFKMGTFSSNNTGKAIIRVNGGDRLIVAPDGNVGIATADPLTRLHIATGQDAGLVNTQNGFVMLGTEAGSNVVIDNNEIIARNNGAISTLFMQNNGGQVQIGSTAVPTGYTLSVAGKAICTELRVQLTGAWPDYVFDEKYQLPSFDRLRQYIQDNKHLPNIPAAKDVEKSGMEVGDMQRRMMEKIEELTLYVLQLEKKVSELEKRNN